MVMNNSILAASLVEYAQKYPALITVKQATEIAEVPKGTIYDWSSQGLLDGFKSKRGRYVRLSRDSFVRFLIEHGVH